MKFYQKLYNFMTGRYGIDNLSKFLFKIYFVLTIINLFINNNILFYIELILLVILIYRFLSKNLYNRTKENKLYLKLVKIIKKPFKNIERNYKYRNDYVFKRCPKCKTTLRLPLPNKRGVSKAKCPNCKNRVRVFTLRKQKIEIIKKNK